MTQHDVYSGTTERYDSRLSVVQLSVRSTQYLRYVWDRVHGVIGLSPISAAVILDAPGSLPERCRFSDRDERVVQVAKRLHRHCHKTWHPWRRAKLCYLLWRCKNALLAFIPTGCATLSSCDQDKLRPRGSGILWMAALAPSAAECTPQLKRS